MRWLCLPLLLLLGCPDDGSGGGAVCGTEQVLVGTVCEPLVCQAGQRQCLDYVELELCNNLGTALSRVPCPVGQICFSGECVDSDCMPGRYRCDDEGDRQICARDGSGWNDDLCPPGQGCTVIDESTVCRDQVCVPGTTRCQAVEGRQPKLQRCNLGGTLWEDETCRVALAEICMEVDGVAGCHRQLCDPGDIGCVDQWTVGTCNEARNGWTPTQDCDRSHGEVCAAGRCVGQCELEVGSTSYMGCEFFAVELANLTTGSHAQHPYALVVANPMDGPATLDVTWKADREAEPSFAEMISNRRITGAANVVLNSEVRDAAGQVVPGLQAMAGPLQDVTVPAGGTATLLVLVDGQRFNVGPSDLVSPGTGLAYRGLRLKSNRPVIAYQFNPLCCNNNHSNDASLLLPVAGLGQRYHAITGPSWPFRGNDYPATVTLVGTRDNTSVTLDFSSAPRHNLILDRPGMPQPDEHGRATVVLNEYQTLNLEAGRLGDLTGITMVSDKPIGVFGGALCTQIPFGFTACDHIEEQLLPDETWGLRYAAAPFKIRNPGSVLETGFFRFVANEEGARIQFDPPFDALIAEAIVPGSPYAVSAGVPACADFMSGGELILGPDENCEFNTRLGFVASAEQRFAIVHFMSGQQSTGLAAHAGDPAMMVVPPVDQFRDRYMFLTPATYYVDYLNVVGPRDMELVLDDRRVDEMPCEDPDDVGEAPCLLQDWQRFGNSEIGSRIIRIDDGPHLIESENGARFGIMVYAYDSHVSYAYPGGLDLTKY